MLLPLWMLQNLSTGAAWICLRPSKGPGSWVLGKCPQNQPFMWILSFNVCPLDRLGARSFQASIWFVPIRMPSTLYADRWKYQGFKRWESVLVANCLSIQRWPSLKVFRFRLRATATSGPVSSAQNLKRSHQPLSTTHSMRKLHPHAQNILCKVGFQILPRKERKKLMPGMQGLRLIRWKKGVATVYTVQKWSCALRSMKGWQKLWRKTIGVYRFRWPV